MKETDTFSKEHRRLAHEAAVAGRLVPDVIAVTALHDNEVRRIHTSDTEFRKFEFLAVMDPLCPKCRKEWASARRRYLSPSLFASLSYVQRLFLMMHSPHQPPEVIAMHGWAGDARCWQPWLAATAARGWHWQCGERGYGQLERHQAAWTSDPHQERFRVVIGHSLGPHLVTAEVMRQADAVVLLASFGAFVPEGRAGRRMRAALDGMAKTLCTETEAEGMLRNFLTQVAAPQAPDLLPPGPADGPLNLERLREDLEILRRCDGLPEGFPGNARVLVIEAGSDRIIAPEATDMLRSAVPAADWIVLEGAGHALLDDRVIPAVTGWVDDRLSA